MAEAFGAKLIPLHVVEPIVYPVETGFVSMTAEAVTPQAVTAMKQKLHDWVSKHVPSSLLARAEVRVGRPYDEIVLAAAEHKADLIVVSTHGYTGIKHVLLGSTAERVVRHAPCPVLTVRRN
jgi:nucleotide-binding universal stress UspA family protein